MLLEITAENFFELFPPAERNISVNGEVVANMGTEVVCDLCNADAISEDKHVIIDLEDNYIRSCYCEECAKKMQTCIPKTKITVE
jgi:hypothetical protein